MQAFAFASDSGAGDQKSKRIVSTVARHTCQMSEDYCNSMQVFKIAMGSPRIYP